MKLVPFALAQALLLAVAAWSGPARADEGLWTFDNFPAAKVKAAYGVDITAAWGARVQAAAVRLSTGCSGSVVSSQGLTLTNDHCVTDCVQGLTSSSHNYQKDGFLAPAHADERRCPQIDADVLVSVTDVTDRMQGAGAGLSGAALVAARDKEEDHIDSEGCGDDLKLHCDVIGLYHGGQYKLYRYHRYTDVRLVFSPGDRTAFFGGDPDNFNFPRYDLDCAFLRLYEDGKPAATPDHLRWSPRAPVAGEVVFAAGNPAPTFREETVSQLETQRDLVLPLHMTELAELRGRMIRFGEEAPDNQRIVDEPLQELENDYKVEVGRLTALDDAGFMAARRAAEASLRAQAIAKLGPPKHGDPWAEMASAQAALPDIYVAYHQLEIGPRGSNLFDYARDLVRAAAERQKRSSDRLPGYTDSQLDALKQAVLNPVPDDPQYEQLLLEFWLSKTRERLTPDDPAARLVLGDESPEALARRLATESKLADRAVRKALWDGGAKAIAASNDPMIRFMVRIDPEARRIRSAYEDQYVGPTTRAAEKIAKARFAVLGDSVYPDGTFSLRLSYGTVAGWTWRGKTVQPFTSFAGLYDRATGAPPFDLDPRWTAARRKLDPAMVFNISTSNDIIGGNSGSPMLDAKGGVIGAFFDGNILSIGGDYGFDPAVNRAVAVTAQAIDAALTKVYGADALARELAAP
jgi:hypothetical protein